jgi:hypothetical protein
LPAFGFSIQTAIRFLLLISEPPIQTFFSLGLIIKYLKRVYSIANHVSSYLPKEMEEVQLFEIFKQLDQTQNYTDKTKFNHNQGFETIVFF